MSIRKDLLTNFPDATAIELKLAERMWDCERAAIRSEIQPFHKKAERMKSMLVFSVAIFAILSFPLGSFIYDQLLIMFDFDIRKTWVFTSNVFD